MPAAAPRIDRSPLCSKVEFSEPPTEQMWGTQALFHDPDGNGWVLVQRPNNE